jgi:hypothetical protein
MTQREAIERAVEAIKAVCREEEPGSGGQMVIGDLATWEIESRIVAAVTKALKARS